MEGAGTSSGRSSRFHLRVLASGRLDPSCCRSRPRLPRWSRKSRSTVLRTTIGRSDRLAADCRRIDHVLLAQAFTYCGNSDRALPLVDIETIGRRLPRCRTPTFPSMWHLERLASAPCGRLPLLRKRCSRSPSNLDRFESGRVATGAGRSFVLLEFAGGSFSRAGFQGVGFHATCQSLARSIEVVGYVR